MKPLKILFLTSQFPVYSETFISRKVDALVESGHCVKVFCTKYNRNHCQAKKYEPLIHEMPNLKSLMSILRLPFDFLKVLVSKPLLLPNIFCSLRKFIQRLSFAANFRESQWDLIHLHYLKNADIVDGLFPDLKIPVVAGVYGYDVTVLPFRTDGLEKNRRRVKAISAMIYSSEFLRSSLNNLVVVEVPEKVIHPEIPISDFPFRQRTKAHNPVRLLSVGRLHWAKGYQFGLATVRELLRQGIDCRYRIVGDGHAREELEYSIRNMELKNYVTLTGAMPSDRVVDEMHKADILLLPSVKEEFGIVLLEAQSTGLPIVASNIGGVKEAVCDGETALLVDDRNHLETVKAIRSLLENKTQYARMSSKGRTFAEQFDIANINKQVVTFYNETIGKTA
jgi:colanic acid/amylovoran biosynthesis glycosyltransferase